MNIDIKNNLALLVLVALVMMTALRNLTSFYYILTLSILAYLLLSGMNKPIRLDRHVSIAHTFFIYSLFVIAWSALYMGSLEFLPGIPRLLLMQVIFLILLVGIKNESQIEELLKLILFVYVIGASSILYQIVVGDGISWFAPQFIRAGMDRYASILGSLTIYGSVAGYALLLFYSGYTFSNKLLIKFIFLLILLGGVVFSLSKSGIVTALLSLIIFIIFSFSNVLRMINIKTILYFTVVMAVLILLLLKVPIIQDYYNTIVVQSFGNVGILANPSNVIIDSEAVTMEHVYKRLTHWSSGMLEEYGDIVYATGVGLQGGAGVMGMHPKEGVYGSAHNSLGDLFFMGGVPYLLIFLALYAFVQLTLFKNRKNHIANVFFMLNLLFFANLMAVSGSIFNPAISINFWLSIVYANMVKSK